MTARQTQPADRPQTDTDRDGTGIIWKLMMSGAGVLIALVVGVLASLAVPSPLWEFIAFAALVLFLRRTL